MNKVTDLSKMLTIIFLIGLVPLLAFYIGKEYQGTISVYDRENSSAVNSSTTGKYSQKESTNIAQVYDSGIKGTAMVGPTCPLARPGTEERCADRPLSTEIKFVNQYGEATTTTSAVDGTYSIDLAPGSYTIVQGGGDLLPSLAPLDVSVYEGQYTNAQLNFDSGIR